MNNVKSNAVSKSFSDVKKDLGTYYFVDGFYFLSDPYDEKIKIIFYVFLISTFVSDQKLMKLIWYTTFYLKILNIYLSILKKNLTMNTIIGFTMMIVSFWVKILTMHYNPLKIRSTFLSMIFLISMNISKN